MLARGGVPRRRRSAGSTPSSSTGGVDALAGAPALLEPLVVEHQAERRRERASSSSTSAATTRCSGASYGEIAADSRSMHKSQGFGVARSARADRRVLQAARATRSRRQAAGEAACRDPRRASTSRWTRFPGGAKLDGLVARAVARLRRRRAPTASIPGAGRDRRRARRACPTPAGAPQKQREVQRADARLRGAVRRGDGGRLPRRARRRPSRSRRRRVDRSPARRDAGRGALPVRRRRRRGRQARRRGRRAPAAPREPFEVEADGHAARRRCRRRRRTGWTRRPSAGPLPRRRSRR